MDKTEAWLKDDRHLHRGDISGDSGRSLVLDIYIYYIVLCLGRCPVAP